MSAVERLALLITADGQGAIREFTKVGQAAERELGGAETRADRLGSRMTSAGAVMMGASAVMAAGMWNVGQAAAAQEQAVGGSEAVFKDSAGAIREWAKSADKSAGLSEEAALRLTTRLGGALKGLGYDQQSAADQSVQLTQIAADLAATYGGTTADAVQALGAAYRGEFDPAEQFNLFLKQSTVDAKAVEMGLAKSTTEVSAYARAQAVTALILEQSTDAQGQFARELDTTTGGLAVASAQFENAKAQIGEGFLPVMAKAGEIGGAAATGIKSADEATGGLLSTALGVGTVVLGAAGAVSFLGGQAIKARDQISSARDAVQNFTQSHGTLVNGLAAGAIVVGGAVAAWQLWEQAVHSTDSQIKAINDHQREAAKTESFDQLVQRFSEINTQIGDIDQTIKNSSAPWDADYRVQLSQMGSELMNTNAEFGNTIGVVNAITAATGANADTVKTWVDTQRQAGHVFSSGEVALAAYTGQVDTNTLSVEDAQAANEAYATSIKSAADALRAATDPFYGAYKAQQSLGEAQNAYNEAVSKFGADSPQAVDAYVALTGAGFDYQSKLLGLAEAQATGDASAQDLAARLEGLRAYGIDPTAVAAEIAAGKFTALSTEANNVPKAVGIDIHTNGFESTWNVLVGLNVQLGQFITLAGQAKQVLSPGLTNGVPSSMARAPGKAGGGPVSPWSVYEVHDTRSPEVLQTPSASYLFTGAEGGTVTNLGNGGGSGSSSVGGTRAQVNFNITLSGGPDGGGSALLNFLRQNQGEVQRALGVG